MRFAKQKKPQAKPGGEKSSRKESVNIFVRSDKDYVESARKFAKENNLSMSALVGNYFRVIHEREKLPFIELPASRSLRGVLKKMRRDRSDYLKYLEEKYG